MVVSERMRRTLSALFLALAAAMLLEAPRTTASPTPLSPVARPAKGKLLIAGRDLLDPNFAETVVLLLEHGDDGSLGVIVNRRSAMQLAQVMPDVEGIGDRSDRLYLGGPVLPDGMLFVLRSDRPREGANHVVDDVYFSPSPPLLERLIAEGIPDDRLRVFAGHAGWAPRQLDAEVARGDWLILPADAGVVFDEMPGDVWRRLIRRDSDLLAHSSRRARAGDDFDIL